MILQSYYTNKKGAPPCTRRTRYSSVAALARQSMSSSSCWCSEDYMWGPTIQVWFCNANGRHLLREFVL